MSFVYALFAIPETLTPPDLQEVEREQTAEQQEEEAIEEAIAVAVLMALVVLTVEALERMNRGEEAHSATEISTVHPSI